MNDVRLQQALKSVQSKSVEELDAKEIDYMKKNGLIEEKSDGKSIGGGIGNSELIASSSYISLTSKGLKELYRLNDELEKK